MHVSSSRSKLNSCPSRASCSSFTCVMFSLWRWRPRRTRSEWHWEAKTWLLRLVYRANTLSSIFEPTPNMWCWQILGPRDSDHICFTSFRCRSLASTWCATFLITCQDPQTCKFPKVFSAVESWALWLGLTDQGRNTPRVPGPFSCQRSSSRFSTQMQTQGENRRTLFQRIWNRRGQRPRSVCRDKPDQTKRIFSLLLKLEWCFSFRLLTVLCPKCCKLKGTGDVVACCDQWSLEKFSSKCSLPTCNGTVQLPS